MVILTRNIDLSVGSIVGLSALSRRSDAHALPRGIPVEVVALIAIAIGLGLGLVNGLLVAVARIPAIIATLATLAIFRGIDVRAHRAARTSRPISCPTASSQLAAIEAARAFPRWHGSRSESRSWAQRRFAGLRGRETSMRSARTPTLLASPAFRRAGA